MQELQASELVPNCLCDSNQPIHHHTDSIPNHWLCISEKNEIENPLSWIIRIHKGKASLINPLIYSLGSLGLCHKQFHYIRETLSESCVPNKCDTTWFWKQSQKDLIEQVAINLLIFLQYDVALLVHIYRLVLCSKCIVFLHLYININNRVNKVEVALKPQYTTFNKIQTYRQYQIR